MEGKSSVRKYKNLLLTRLIDDFLNMTRYDDYHVSISFDFPHGRCECMEGTSKKCV